MFPRKTSVVVIVAIGLLVIKTVTLCLLGVISYFRHHDREMEYVQTALTLDADQIVPNLARPVSSLDSLGIKNVVEGMMLDPALKRVVVKSADNTVLCARERDAQGKVTEARGEILAEESLVEKREIKFNDQTLATVTLFGTTKPVEARTGTTLRWIIINILWVDTVLFAGAFLLLNFWVFKPLREVEATAAKSGRDEKAVPMGVSHGEFESIRLSLEKIISQLKAEIAERRRAEEILREKQAQLFLAMDIAKLGYWEFDIEKDLFTGDEYLFQLLGTTSAQEGGLSLSSEEYIRRFVHPSDAPIVANEIALAFSVTDPSLGRHSEHRVIRKDGTEGVMLVRSRTVMGSSGRPSRILGTTQDVTERKELERQFLRAQRMESLGVLAGGVAHDLNNSLAPILMAVSLMELKFTDAPSQKLIATVELSARRAVEMVQQLLSFARGVDGRRMELQLGLLVRDVEKLINDTFLKSVRVSTHVSPKTWTVVGDPTQIHQVLLNLCVNARDAMPNGGEINIGAENVTIVTPPVHTNPEAKAGAYVLLKVTDTGLGIRPEIIDKIFDPFFTTKEVGKGTGLGLSTSLAIVRSHGGFIHLQSEVGKGTTFEIYLPAKRDLSNRRELKTDTELQRGNGELVLIVDDEAEVRQMMQQTLETFGYRAITASGGDEAAMIFAIRHSEIDVVITDMMMPVMDGPVTIQVLRTIDPKVRIIATSGVSTKDQAGNLGVKHFLMKPYTAETLLAELRIILEEAA